jgi:hypothetical protein
MTISSLTFYRVPHDLLTKSKVTHVMRETSGKTGAASFLNFKFQIYSFFRETGVNESHKGLDKK